MPNPPRRVWRDWVLVGLVLGLAILESALRNDVTGEPIALAMVAMLSLTLLWRRTHPLPMLAITFGAVGVLDLVAIATGTPPVGLDTMAFLLVLPYSLFRWGSGRDVAIGSLFIVVVGILANVADFSGWVETVFGSIVLLLPAVFGTTVRFRASSRTRELDQIRLREREQLARELHDTVAHHVSAIAIQAQVGQTLAATNPEAPLRALEVVEAEASRTLAEMRAMVSVLRESDELDLAPQRGVADIERLAMATPGPVIEVERSGELSGLGPALDAALYRLAQESVTNAVRHARNATRVDVAIFGNVESVRLTVSDDGETAGAGRHQPGYGIIGMEERVKLLGGTITAGPDGGRGWRVVAELPRRFPG